MRGARFTPGFDGRFCRKGVHRDCKTPGRGQLMEENKLVCQTEMLWGKGQVVLPKFSY